MLPTHTPNRGKGLSFPHVTHFRCVGTSLSGNLKHGYPIETFGYDNGGDDR